MSLLANSNAIESGGYNIDRSLRFRSSASAYLNRTPASAGNRQTWTWSGWVKRGALGTIQHLFSNWEYGGGNNNQHRIAINTDDRMTFMYYDGPSNTYIAAKTPNMVFRDPAAWYHIVCAWDTTNATAADRLRVYVNGTRQTSFYSTNVAGGGGDINPSQNQNGLVNKTENHTIGSFYNVNYGAPFSLFDGYLAEVNFIDGQALTPSSFGSVDASTGAWVPNKYLGSYGTNGFYLDFKDNTSATTLAYDKSGNGNNWTANNISTTAGATYDSMTDVPTLTSATAANYCVLNPLTISGYYGLSYGNLRYLHPSVGDDIPAYGTFGATSGKIYFEAYLAATGYVANRAKVGVTALYGDIISSIGNTDHSYSYGMNGQKGTNSSYSAYGATYAIGDTIGVALDIDAGTLTFYKNNASQGVAFSGLSSTNGAFTFGVCEFNGGQWDVNFGQRPFSYTPPTGFKALNTFNLPDPTIKKPNQYMDATTYTGDGTNKNIVNAAGFQPDLVWVKIRNQPYSNNLTDAVRGTGLRLQTDTTAAESSGGLLAFNSNGFQVNGTQGELGTNGNSYVGWQWKESATAGFDIVTYTGTGSATTVAHSLGVAPKFMIVKDRSASNPWPVYHASLGSQYYTLLNATDASYNNLANYWGASGPSSTTFTVGPYGGNNTNGNNYVAYLFAEIPGFSKFGSYTGNGSTDGPFVYCGFRPKYVMIKRTDSGNNWFVLDSSRSSYNLSNQQLLPNSSAAESTNTDCNIDMLSNGFKLRTALDASNGSGGTYIFAAFAENPTKYALAR